MMCARHMHPPLAACEAVTCWGGILRARLDRTMCTRCMDIRLVVNENKISIVYCSPSPLAALPENVFIRAERVSVTVLRLRPLYPVQLRRDTWNCMNYA